MRVAQSVPLASFSIRSALNTKKVAGFEEVDYITICNTGDPGLEDVVGPESIQDSLHRSSLMASTLR
jgi:hypothetical protein